MEISFLRPGTGLGFITRILKDYSLIPQKNEKTCIKILKGTAVFLISSVALPIICTYAITHYNAPGLITKSIGAISSYFCNRQIFNFSYVDFFRDIRLHALFAICDFFVIVASPIFTLFLLVKPECIQTLSANINKLC